MKSQQEVLDEIRRRLSGHLGHIPIPDGLGNALFGAVFVPFANAYDDFDDTTHTDIEHRVAFLANTLDDIEDSIRDLPDFGDDDISVSALLTIGMTHIADSLVKAWGVDPELVQTMLNRNVDKGMAVHFGDGEPETDELSDEMKEMMRAENFMWN